MNHPPQSMRTGLYISPQQTVSSMRLGKRCSSIHNSRGKKPEARCWMSARGGSASGMTGCQKKALFVICLHIRFVMHVIPSPPCHSEPLALCHSERNGEKRSHAQGGFAFGENLIMMLIKKQALSPIYSYLFSLHPKNAKLFLSAP